MLYKTGNIDKVEEKLSALKNFDIIFYFILTIRFLYARHFFETTFLALENYV